MARIDWTVSESEWAKAERETIGEAAGSAYDTECSAHYRLLLGALDIHEGSLHLFGSTDSGVEVSLIDFAYQLMIVVAALQSGSFVGERIRFLDDNIWIAFDVEDADRTCLTTNIEPSTAIIVGKADLLEASERFLHSF